MLVFYRSLRDFRARQCKTTLKWIKEAESNNFGGLVPGPAYYTRAEGRTKIAEAFNGSHLMGEINRHLFLGRDHHDVGGQSPLLGATS